MTMLLMGVGGSGSRVADANFASVKLLLGFEGADGATGAPGMTDESASARGNATVSGNAQIDTAQFKYGAASLLLDGTGDKIAFADSTDWEFDGEFTIEAFLRINSLSPITSTVMSHGTASTAYGWWLTYSNAGTLRFRFDDGADGTALHDITQGSAPMTTATWYHVAVDRDASNKLRLYVDGVMRASKTAATGTSANTAGTLDIGMVGSSSPMNGWVDEVRITKGVARYASDGGFAPPAAAFPRS
ncbi:LamG domain-containing protein [Bradyrhizobium sp. AUGA SZCCT0169]|uniref:LamG domain-containing protein n=1 Tax=Bradyrhizobium sp. AUGA SZCCT0169 TaxID=2807663 RepID=UPI001BA993D3|nr:LamG domain-containing protein [Bradyrhizobium sp. AUGA SZCCT0169]MBR1246139.1 LamG domain-containing protein [Bradyrhizobium sp. AUGA SZCCT0169]